MQNKKIVLYVTGSIAAYKSVYLLRLFQKQGADVKVVMTPFAEKFVSQLTFASLAKCPVYSESNFTNHGETIDHIELAKWADISVVAPASADFIAKMANGIADNFALTTLLATDTSKYVVPAMNDVMWNNFATRKNIETLEQNGIKILNPEYGRLAEGYKAKGRMIEPEEIVQTIYASDNPKLLSGKNVLITAGGTIEDIDPVRYISNRSTGKMGYALADVAVKQGANVTLISANCHLQVPENINFIKVKTSDELKNSILTKLPKNDVLIMAAAVSDFKPVHVAKQKIKKSDDSNELVLHLQKTDDILKLVADQKKANQVIIGFAAETNDVKRNAKLKLEKKHLDLIVLNDVSNQKIGFGSDDNQVTIMNKNGILKQTGIESKEKIAKTIINVIKQQLD
ncbi:bifunctional phosphopantothenoylcysteine decarboxylase/phosphopantothenate--cysteine ligase CoaBC [Fructilactobacillus sanfranciscensis]|uniref:bifunctional phosphopantothenoylcysteine decarboxylase/phosphopantothenate--cysteine ligase CoaBC n=1 Tax=Fructilactobacillus sanfranciscensis TaxID=1625 RepID=UPI000D4A2E35|nr:bifunctional phosphopantothenoylcysteine decarboxylase/phosphopantothenate--cysteine ligase CoaBC [Fructilactobacillus sanfranciscensis]POH21057.1 phosphopantothenoylcysteine decarboxylase [Fructilactobacillus sanfranciscensis]WED56798.1 bifunctional phosphopantothenoylcysteine decarboxylase/phosphopantothenate--cysteine ligase CoaBC [Fructilactobacillus sanfranciscensis]